MRSTDGGSWRRRSGCGRARSLLRHCEEPLRRSNPESLRRETLDCFAALAMTMGEAGVPKISIHRLHDIRRLRGIIRRGLLDFLRSHRPRDVAHLLADVIAALAGGKGLQLRLHVGLGLAFEPRAARLVVEAAVAGGPRRGRAPAGPAATDG